MTESDLLSAVGEALARNPAVNDGSFTVSELADATGVAMATARRRIREGQKAGRVRDGRSPRLVSGGHYQNVVAYWLT